MPEGVEILEKEEIIETVIPWWVSLTPLLCLTATAVIGFGLLYLGIYMNAKWLGVTALLVSIAGCIFTPLYIEPFIESSAREEIATGRYEYVVVVSDNSALKELYESYEIVDATGDYYVIRDKER